MPAPKVKGYYWRYSHGRHYYNSEKYGWGCVDRRDDKKGRYLASGPKDMTWHKTLAAAKEAVEIQVHGKLKHQQMKAQKKTTWVPLEPERCDLCPAIAVWQHKEGGRRCRRCPRPETY